jgi:uncharacterized protein (TIGR00369 family)
MPPADPPEHAPAETSRVHALIRSIFDDRIPFNQVLGLHVESFEQNQMGFAMRPDLVGHFDFGRLHGGVISATLDVVGSFALMNAITAKYPGETYEQIAGRFKRIGTIDLRVDYLHPGQGKHFIAEGEVTRLGGRLGSTRMTLVNDVGKLIATGAAVYVVS